MKKRSEIDERLLSIDELAAYIGIKKSTLYAWVHGRKIKYVKVGRLVKFRICDINDWIEAHTVGEKKI